MKVSRIDNNNEHRGSPSSTNYDLYLFVLRASTCEGFAEKVGLEELFDAFFQRLLQT